MHSPLGRPCPPSGRASSEGQGRVESLDSAEVVNLVTLNAIIDSILGLVIALLVVSRVVRKQWTNWLQSKEADPYLDRVGERVVAKLPSMPKVPTPQEIVAAIPPIKVPTTEDFMEAIEPRLQGFEDVNNK